MNKLEKIEENIRKITRFFPFSMLMVVLLMLMVNVLILNSHAFDTIFRKEENLFQIIILLLMSFFIFTWASLHQHISSAKVRIVTLIIAIIMVIYLGGEILFSQQHFEVIFFKSFFLTIGFILGYTVIPFWEKKEDNLQLLIYLLHLKHAFFGSFRLGILFILGLLIVSGTILFLFGIGFETFFTIIGFNGFVGYFFYLFLSRLMQNPHDLRYAFKKETQRSYLSLLFYVFTAVIFTALNLFVFKIIVTQELPRGQVAWMVMGFSFFAYLSYLSLLPYSEKIKRYTLLIWGTLLLQSFVLLGSISVRVWEYGFTEKRYLLVAYGLWMMGISLYFLWQKEKARIFWLFASLWFVVLFSQIGPFNGYRVSRDSQQGRLSTFHQAFQKAGVEKKRFYFDEMYGVIQYLSRYHGEKSVQEVIPELTHESIARYEYMKRFFGIEKGSALDKVLQKDKLSYTSHSKNVFNVKGYDYFLTSVYMTDFPSIRTLNKKFFLTFTTDIKRSEIFILLKEEEYRLSIKKLLNKVKENLNVLDSDFIVKLEADKIELVFHITRIYRDRGLTVEADVLVNLKDKN
jgi:hypothetical protein